MTTPTRPTVVLIGEDGNAFNILGRCKRAARDAGWTPEEWTAFQEDAKAGDYSHLLATVQQHFDVE